LHHHHHIHSMLVWYCMAFYIRMYVRQLHNSGESLCECRSDKCNFLNFVYTFTFTICVKVFTPTRGSPHVIRASFHNILSGGDILQISVAAPWRTKIKIKISSNQQQTCSKMTKRALKRKMNSSVLAKGESKGDRIAFWRMIEALLYWTRRIAKAISRLQQWKTWELKLNYKSHERDQESSSRSDQRHQENLS